MSRSNPGLRHRFAARRRVLERSITGLALACAITAASTGWADAIPPTPIPDGAPATAFIGAPGKGTKVKATKVPQHPFMSKNATSNIHNDAFMTDTYAKKGPIGQNMQRVSYFTGGGPCASITFDKKGRIIAACIVPANPQLKLFDPKTLNTLASMPLPPPSRRRRITCTRTSPAVGTSISTTRTAPCCSRPIATSTSSP